MLLSINGCRLYAEEMGPRSSGDVVLAFHSPGGSGDSSYVRSTFESLSDSARVVTFDLRGNGRSSEEGAGVPSFENLSADAEALRRTLDLGEVVVAGSSGAGYLALEYALRYPEAVRGLLLWSTAPFHTPLDVLRRNAAALGVSLDWDRFDRYWTGNLRDDADLKRASRDFAALRRASGPPSSPASGKAPGGRYWRYASHNVAMREQSAGWTVEGRLKEIEAPTLILHGDKDWIIPLENGTKLRRGIRDSRMEVFQGCGHWLHIEDRPRFEASVRELLLQVRR
jgi:proline iminopeptidase